VTPLWLRVRAPFAAFRGMQAGVYRATSPTMPHSAAWGLLLNLAGIETRNTKPNITTLVRTDAPPLCMCIGAVRDSELASLYQQLHTYPVGASGKEFKERTRGAKYWIAPARRELLVGLDVMLGVRSDQPEVLDRIVAGAQGKPLPGDDQAGERYGLPFAGDNNLLFDRIDVLDAPEAARWYLPVGPDDPPRRGSCRLTVGIDRGDASRTTNILFAPAEEPTAEVPEAAWIWTPRRP